MLTCKDVSRLISGQQEHSLRFRERLGLRAHLLLCVSCRRFERQMAAIRRGLRLLGPGGAPDGTMNLSPEARERIRKALAARCDHGHDH